MYLHVLVLYMHNIHVFVLYMHNIHVFVPTGGETSTGLPNQLCKFVFHYNVHVHVHVHVHYIQCIYIVHVQCTCTFAAHYIYPVCPLSLLGYRYV